MPQPGIVVMHIPRSERKSGVLTLEAPEGELNGVHLELYIRAGTEAEQHPVGDAPRDYVDAIEQKITAADLKAADAVFVDATVVLKQPAQLEGSLTFAGILTVGDESRKAQVTVSLDPGSTAALGTLTWWVEP